MIHLVYIHFICLETAAALPALTHSVEICYMCRVQVTVVLLGFVMKADEVVRFRVGHH